MMAAKSSAIALEYSPRMDGLFSMTNLAHVYFGLLFCLGVSVSASDWPQWRGPDGQGHSSATGLPLTWSEAENVAWKTKIPGRGWSSPVIEGNCTI